MSLPAWSRRLAPSAALIALTLTVAGCGGNDEGGSGSADGTSPPAAAQAPAAPQAGGAPLDGGNAPEQQQAERDDPSQKGNRPGDPELPSAKGDALEPPAEGERLLLRSEGREGRWRIGTTLNGGSFCVTAATPGPADPPPACGDTTTVGLTLATGDKIQASVNPIRETARGDQTKLLVWGTVLESVPSISVEYGKAQKQAQRSTGATTLRLDPVTVESLGDTGGKIPSRVKVRTFAVSFESQAGNPPTVAIAKAAKSGAITLTLQ